MLTSEIEQQIKELNDLFSDSPAEKVISFFINKYGDKIAFATSLGAEDQILTHIIAGINPQTRIITLDTGRLFPETIDLIETTNLRYNINIKVFFPDAGQVESMVNTKGINLFYESIENRKECCHIRKILPLTRAMSGTEAWISGLRSEQSVTRKDLKLLEWDSNFNLIKINPLRNWSEEQVWEYIHTHNIPYNKLHDNNYPSIGCQPCTRAVNPGDDIRAGRWWWEQPEHKECGLHQKND
ncbi:MAG: phosphoadenylyl-sulfate reductase [Bacteroidetes bacterium]|nr:phosphoadenylyl-sulfate reductase [Bacteroidota bacterium]